MCDSIVLKSKEMVDPLVEQQIEEIFSRYSLIQHVDAV